MFNFIENVNINLGPIKLNLGTKKGRTSAGMGFIILGIVLIMSLMFNEYLPNVLTDILSKIGVISFVIGGFLSKVDTKS